MVDVGVLAWTQARMVLHIAAAYGLDPTHPDIAPNFSNSLSRNFTEDLPVIDGPCTESSWAWKSESTIEMSMCWPRPTSTAMWVPRR